ncbi:MAG: hypothetical protein L0Z50_15145, partial [Verrucomicrobiales bacterium]|nr:hypothetical protein [Verrucomicrobiales bacterium]
LQANRVATGHETVASGQGATAMGWQTTARGQYSTAMGLLTDARGDASTSFGRSTLATGLASIAAGWQTAAAGNYSTALGLLTTATGEASSALGHSTVASGLASTALGHSSTAGGDFAFAAGYHAAAMHGGSFVWADSEARMFSSSTNDQFRVRANGGAVFVGASTMQTFEEAEHQFSIRNRFYADSPDFSLNLGYWIDDFGDSRGIISVRRGGQPAWLSLNPEASVEARISTPSDRNRKTGFASVEPRAVLEKVSALPLTTWCYTNALGIPHLGPVAQDFHAAFGLGADDKHIDAVDADGVALAAIQGLNHKLEQERASREREVGELRQTINELRMFVRQLTNANASDR